jgi:ABC-type polysaccharide/polyol phosphate export permease
MVRRELRQKYKGSALGVVWYLINPLVLMGAYTLMFGVLFQVQNIADYPIFLMVGLVVWTFFSQSLLSAAPSLIDQSSLVRKARFPRAMIPSSTVAVQLVTFLAVLALLIPVALTVRGSADPAVLLIIPIVALLSGFVLGLAWIVSVLHAHFRDVSPILAAALLPWFFITPIFFRPDGVGALASHHWATILLGWVNPVAPFISALRSVLYDGAVPDWGHWLYLACACALALAVGSAVFRRMQAELAVVL